MAPDRRNHASSRIVLAVAASFVIPPVYRAKASFVANSSSESKLPAAEPEAPAVGGLISQLGGSLGGDPSESPNFYVQLFQSRELLTRLAQSRYPNPRTDAPNDSASLIDIMRIKKDDPQRSGWSSRSSRLARRYRPASTRRRISSGSIGGMPWPELASQIANRLVDDVEQVQSRDPGLASEVEAAVPPVAARQRADAALHQPKRASEFSTSRIAV